MDEDIYPNAKDFKRRVIQASFAELEEKADIYFEADWKTKVSHNVRAKGNIEIRN